MVTEYAYDLGAIRRYLLNDASVAAQVGPRVFANELPAAEAPLMARKCVVITSAGLGSRSLSGRSYMPISSRTKLVRCYGATPYESRQVFDAVNAAMKALTRRLVTPDGGLSAVLLYSAVSTGGVTTTREQQTDWPVSFSSYDVMCSDVV